MTLAVLANKTGLSVSYLSLVESGKRDPSLQTLRGVASAFDVPLVALLALAMSPKDVEAIPGSAKSKLFEALMLLVEEIGEPTPELPPLPDPEC